MKQVLVLPILLVLLLGAGCSSTGDPSNSGSSPSGPGSSNSGSEVASDSPSSPGGGHTPGSDARADIDQIADRFSSVPSFQAKMRAEGGAPFDATLKFIAPDRFHFQNAGTMEVILIGKDSYMKVGNDWRKMSAPLDLSVASAKSVFDKEGRKAIREVTYQGEETVDGQAAYVYSFQGTDPNVLVGENDSRVWVGKSNGLPIKVEAVYKRGEMKKMIINYDYKTPVSIDPPVK